MGRKCLSSFSPLLPVKAFLQQTCVVGYAHLKRFIYCCCRLHWHKQYPEIQISRSNVFKMQNISLKVNILHWPIFITRLQVSEWASLLWNSCDNHQETRRWFQQNQYWLNEACEECGHSTTNLNRIVTSEKYEHCESTASCCDNNICNIVCVITLCYSTVSEIPARKTNNQSIKNIVTIKKKKSINNELVIQKNPL